MRQSGVYNAVIDSYELSAKRMKGGTGVHVLTCKHAVIGSHGRRGEKHATHFCALCSRAKRAEELAAARLTKASGPPPKPGRRKRGDEEIVQAVRELHTVVSHLVDRVTQIEDMKTAPSTLILANGAAGHQTNAS